jgi:hypothetical protein
VRGGGSLVGPFRVRESAATAALALYTGLDQSVLDSVLVNEDHKDTHYGKGFVVTTVHRPLVRKWL